jgi:hypothetical protein
MTLGVVPPLGQQRPPPPVLLAEVGEPIDYRGENLVQAGVGFDQRGQLAGAVPLERGQEQLLLGGDVGVHRAHAELGLRGDRVHRRAGVAVPGDDLHGRVDDQVAGAGPALRPGQPGPDRITR